MYVDNSWLSFDPIYLSLLHSHYWSTMDGGETLQIHRAQNARRFAVTISNWHHELIIGNVWIHEIEWMNNQECTNSWKRMNIISVMYEIMKNNKWIIGNEWIPEIEWTNYRECLKLWKIGNELSGNYEFIKNKEYIIGNVWILKIEWMNCREWMHELVGECEAIFNLIILKL